MTINSTTYAFLTTAEAVHDFAASFTADAQAELIRRCSKMPKAKALELINATIPGAEATDVYTVRANIETAWVASIAALTDRLSEIDNDTADQPVLAGEMDEEEIAAIIAEAPSAAVLTTTDDKITALLDALVAAASKNEKKAIRAKLRRLGYRLSDNRTDD